METHLTAVTRHQAWQELFETPNFCLEQDMAQFALTQEADQARVVLPVSYFERAGLARYTALAVVDADGVIKANDRKTHIPQAPGYKEKFFFNSGDSGFQVVETRFGRLGCGIC